RGECRTVDLQQSANQRRPAILEWPEGRRRLHAQQGRGQWQHEARRRVEYLRGLALVGRVELRPTSRAERVQHLRSALLEGSEYAAEEPGRRLADFRGEHLPNR